MMVRRIIIVIVIVFFHFTGQARSLPDFAYVDSITYQLYINGSWKELIRTGEDAIKEGIDYYFLRMRIGIASYEIEDFPRAISHFRKSLELNSADENAMEYLYFSFLFIGREMEASEIAKSFSPRLIEKLTPGNRGIVRSVSLNATGSQLRNTQVIDDYSFDADPSRNGFQNITRNFRFFSASLIHDAGPGTRLTHSPGYLSKSYMVYTSSDNEAVLATDAYLSQFQYYLSGKILTGNGVYLVPAIHYLAVRLPYEITIAGRGRTTLQTRHFQYQHNLAISMGLEKYYRRIKPGFSAGYSYLNRQSQVQGSFNIIWYIFGNLNLYSISEITWYSKFPAIEDSGNFILTQNVGFRTLPWLWIEFGGSLGEKFNYASSGSYFVYNDPLVIMEEYRASLIIPIFRKGIELSLHSGFNRGESRFISSFNNDMQINPVNINYYKISGGIKWNF
jgi:hypothetical protein